MKGLALLALILVGGCGQSAAPPLAARADPAASHKPLPKHADEAQSGPFDLVGLPTGPHTYFNLERCRTALDTYGNAMENGLGEGAGAQLKCVPT